MLSISSILLLLLILPLSAYQVMYEHAFEHANQTTLFNESMELTNAGYKSHYDSLSFITSGTILCYGAYSCSKASLISGLRLECDADSSCSKVSDIQIHYLNQSYPTSIDISGVNGMSYSTVSHAAKLNIFCRGEQSCAHSVVSGFISIRGTGAYSLLNATIDSINGTTNVTIRFDGYYAGFNTKITCRIAQLCIIQCHFSGCNNIHLNCNDNCIIKGTPTDHILSIQDVLLYDSLRISQQNDASCSAPINLMNFDNYEERLKSQNVLNNSDEGPMCCRAQLSCSGSNITYTSSINQSIICNARWSCSANSRILSHDPVFCGAKWACANSYIVTTGIVYCNAYASCTRSFIFKSHHVYCTAQEACTSATITSNGTDLRLYLSGNKAGRLANVTCNAWDECSIFCYGYDSCLDLMLVCDGTCNVYCDVNNKCPIGWTATPTTATPTTSNPSPHPTVEPTVEPTINPSVIPSMIPSVLPSRPSAPPYVLSTAMPTGALARTNTTTLGTLTTESQLIVSSQPSSLSTTSSEHAISNEPEHIPSESSNNTLLIIVVLSLVICGVCVVVFIGRECLAFIGHMDVEERKEQKQNNGVLIHASQQTEIVENNVNKIDIKKQMLVENNMVSQHVDVDVVEIQSEDHDSTDTAEGNRVTEEGMGDNVNSLEIENVIWGKETAQFVSDYEAHELHSQASEEHGVDDHLKRQNTKGIDDANIADDEFVINAGTLGVTSGLSEM
eukprot:208400_1